MILKLYCWIFTGDRNVDDDDAVDCKGVEGN